WLDIKDPRFFGTLAAVPTLHFLLTWLRRDDRLGIHDYVALVAQASILVLAIHVRWTTLWVLIALLAFFVLAIAWPSGLVSVRRLGEWRRSQPARVAGACAAVLGAGLVVASIAAHPVYRLDGDLLHHPLWHNVMTALENDAQNLLESGKLTRYWNDK